MAANTVPIYVDASQISAVTIAIANTGRDGSGVIAPLVTAATNGTLILGLSIKATGTTTAGMIRIWLLDSNATTTTTTTAAPPTNTYYLLDEVIVDAITPSGTVKSFKATWVPDTNLMINSGWSLGVSTHNAETFDITGYAFAY